MYWIVQLVLALIIILLFSYTTKLFVNQVLIYRSLRALPNVTEGQHWLLGHGPKVMKLYHEGKGLDYISSMATKCGGSVMTMNLGPLFDLCICSSPESAKISLGQDPKAEFVYSPMMAWLGESLLTGSGKKWARTRRLLTPAFHFDVLKPYVAIYNDSATQLLEKINTKDLSKPFDIYGSVSLLTLDIMLRCACSFKSNCQTENTHSRYISAVYQLSDLAMERLMFAPAYFDIIYALMPSYYKNKAACKIVHKLSMDVIRQRRSELQNREASYKQHRYLDFIDILLQAKDELGRGMTDDEIRAEVDTFMFEGHDTTAASIAWTLYNLAKYPEHQKLCVNEIQKIMDDKNEIEWEDLKNLPYLKWCIKESLRLFPPVAMNARVLSQDRVIDGYNIRKGSWTITNIYGIHHNPIVWQDPEKFDPLRFSPASSTNRHSHAFIPFSSGQRNCIGQEFAMNEELVVLSHILNKYEISWDSSFPDIIKHFTIILRPRGGLFLKFKPRY